MKIGVIGLGLIGGSIAKACKTQGYTVFGYDTNLASMASGVREGVIEDTHSWEQWLDGVDDVVVATPLATVPDWIERVVSRPRQRAGTLVEVGSVKRPLMPALHRLQSPWSYLSIHPMAGKESRGYGWSHPRLFVGHATAVIDAEGWAGTDVMERWMQILGTRPVVVSAEAHDAMVAEVSHLPYLVAAALLYTVGDSNRASLQLAGTGFRDTTRVGGSDPGLWHEILVANRGPILHALRHYARSLDAFTNALEQGENLPGMDIIAEVRQAIL